ncbi:hypothetical protein ACFL5O_09835 [Myxococcota bacterium]
MPKGAAPKITMGSLGNEPRLALGSMLPPGGPKSVVRLRMSLASGGRSTVPFDFLLAFEPGAKPAASSKTAAGTIPSATAVPPGGTEGGAFEYVARVTHATVDASQVPRVDPKVKADLVKFNGSKIRFKLVASGVGSDFVVERSQTAPEEFEETLRSLSELLATVLLPYPQQPVGTDAYWMATTRETVAGIDTVAYRLIRVQKVQGNSLSLQVDSKRYAATTEVPGMAELELQQFKSLGQGTLTVSQGSAIPTEAKLGQELVALMSMSNQPGQMSIMQTRLNAVLSRP